mmetsp:Transcript_90682/g.282028  ORF Transcript_90682/g.282028 Transcript_90682/m.282028 type:complete len:282 (-) Transcript_90682:3-848(-)
MSWASPRAGAEAARGRRGAVRRRAAPEPLAEELLGLIPKMAFGAPATNATVPEATAQRISEAAARLEPSSKYAGAPFAESPEALAALDGPWRLLYSDASEITRLSKLPLGFRLGPVFQPVDVAGRRFENQALVRHALRLASGHTRVLARFELADLGTENRAGVVNAAGNRVNVRFERVVFTLCRLLLLPLFGLLRKVAKPKGPSEQAGVTPTLDITYLDGGVRIGRGGDGSLFVLQRPEPGGEAPMPMLQDTELQVTEAKTYNAATDILPAGKGGAGAGEP